VLSLPVFIEGRQTTLLEILQESGGGTMVPWYVPDQLNEPRFAKKLTTVFGRATDAIGDSAVPLLTPTVAGGDAQVIHEIQQALIAECRKRKEFAVWAKPGEVTDEFRELLAEEESDDSQLEASSEITSTLGVNGSLLTEDIDASD
jgi:hypothetical protein